jgi:hypothetical protein
MILLYLLPVLLGAASLWAHFSRHDLTALAALSLMLPAALLVRRRWAARAIQAGLILRGLEWLGTEPGQV